MKPNIIMMISHDSGKMFPSYGYQVEAPNFERLANSSVQFDNYFCPSPQCSPSRGSILTGLYPHNNGLMGLAHLGFSISENIKTLPMLLKNGGYETVLIGLSHETINEPPKIEDRIFSSTTELGYENYIPVQGDRAPFVANQAIDFLEKRSKDKPLYLNLGFFETHRDFDEYVPYADSIEDVEVFNFLYDTTETREDVALFNGSLKVLDTAVGEIMDFVENSSYKNNTIMIFTTDHGVPFPGAKGTLKETGLGTVLLIKLPGIEQPKLKKALLCNVDLMPTILELAGIERPTNIDGKSFADLLTTSKDEGREEFFTEMTWHDQYRPMRGIRTKEYSYVRNFEDGPKVYVTVDAHLSPSGEIMRDKFYVPNESEELYDLSKDPEEQLNVINEPRYGEIAEALRAKVEAWMQTTNDPLLEGPIKGHGSSRWEKEIAAGRAYPGKVEYEKRMKNKEKDLT
ncbi:sulfatase [Enterococcus ureasiticus]|uniref:Sulfatase n=1 Tax=Enterococcus ureasiticus TaxID=903984 RepID=A0A1E5GA36_9ENTE|nr:sulfatase [Enterococcus ureasiticus]OEG09564.1 sulfatase [Enterococcus ureasiticus]